MRKFICLSALLFATFAGYGQYYKDSYNPDILHIRQPRNLVRNEFIIPDIDGYKGYKADLHTHSIYSDGAMSMGGRIRESWADGLDIMAVTEHLEYRSNEPDMVKWMRGYVKKGAKPVNYYITRYKVMPEQKDLMVDFQYPVEHAIKVAKLYDITIIPGIEITREPLVYGHFNALFTTDNNAIHGITPEQSLRNAKAQGAIIMHNHPGWRRKNLEMLEFDRMIYEEGLIDGIEVMNSAEFYPKAITRALKHNLFMSSNTDIHGSSTEMWGQTGAQRNMTFIFAKDKSLTSVREAIEARRTIAYSYGTLAGEESLLRKFIDASIEVRMAGADKKGRKIYLITNKSSVEFLLQIKGGETARLTGLSSTLLTGNKTEGAEELVFESVWCGENSHISIKIE